MPIAGADPPACLARVVLGLDVVLLGDPGLDLGAALRHHLGAVEPAVERSARVRGRRERRARGHRRASPPRTARRANAVYGPRHDRSHRRSRHRPRQEHRVLHEGARAARLRADHEVASSSRASASAASPTSGSATGTPKDTIHVAFRASGRAQVRAFYDAAIAAGGKDNGAPGDRARTITSTTTARSCAIPTATTSRPSATSRSSAKLPAMKLGLVVGSCSLRELPTRTIIRRRTSIAR